MAFMRLSKKLLQALPVLFLSALLVPMASASLEPSNYFQGFETDISGWDQGTGQANATRVASGTHGIPSKTGGFHGEVVGPHDVSDDGSAHTNWGGYSSTFPANGYTTQVDIYLDTTLDTGTTDIHFDWSSAINDSSGVNHRDFIFNAGTDPLETTPGFVISPSNNAGAGENPSDPSHDPLRITTSGWYTFRHYFHNNGSGVLAVDMSVLDSAGHLLKSWTLSNPSDLISGLGGNRYGWFPVQGFPFLAIDNSKRSSLPETIVVDDNLACPEAVFSTIQGAIDAAHPGDTIQVCAGTYHETLTVDKALTLLGPNDSISPNGGSRVGEAIIVPATSDPLNATSDGPSVIDVTATGVTIKGFTVDGDNPLINSNIDFNGADVDAQYGIYYDTPAINPDIVISNNIVKNIGDFAIYATSFDAGPGNKDNNSLISDNLVDNVLGGYGQGIRISDNAWANVINNTVTRVRNGIVVENFSGRSLCPPASVIDGNTISSFSKGIRFNLHYGYSGPGFTLSNNTISPYVQAVRPPAVITIENNPPFSGPPTAYQGIRVELIQNAIPVTVSGNTLTGNKVVLSGGGYTRDEGLMVTGSSSVSPNILFTGNQVSGFILGAFNETPAVPVFEANQFTGNDYGIYENFDATNGLIAHHNDIFDNGFGVENDGPTTVDARYNWWGSDTGPFHPVTNPDGMGDQVSDEVDYGNYLDGPYNAPPDCGANVAAATYGSTATASSEYSPPDFPASGVIDGEHDGNNYGHGGVWASSSSSLPQSVTVNFNTIQSIDTIDVYTLKDDVNSGSKVGDFTTFTQYGITAFDVQYWNGSSWQNVPGGSVTGNNHVKTRFTFSPISTTQIRVVVNNAVDGFSRIVEIEAYSCAPVGLSTTSLTSSVNPSTVGQSVTFTATVTGSSPTGTVTFKDGGDTLGTGTLDGSGQATYTTSSLSAGTHSITAVYGGDASNQGSTSSAVSQVVVTTTTTALTSTPNPSTSGQSVTFTATVTGSGTPTGTVDFKEGATTLGSGTLNGSGQATFSTSSLTEGSHSIIAVYAGDSSNQGSASSAVNQVVLYVTTTTLTSSLNPSGSGQNVHFTATVTGGGGTPTGTITFKDGATNLAVRVMSAGGAFLNITTLSQGTHNITAVYSGDSTHQGSTSNTIAQVVLTATTTTLNLTPNPSVVGQNIVFTATVTGGSTPTGTVKFYDGATFLAERPVKPTGEAVLNRATLSAGTHSITAVYGGDATHVASASSPVSQVVLNTTTTSLTSTPNPSGPGQSVTFTATVTGSGAPTGTVTFKDGGDTLGTGTLNGSGQATFSTSSLSSGTHSITAVYAGDTSNQTSASSAVNQVVLYGTTTTLTSSVNPSTVGQSVTFTATVTGSGTPTGNVAFKEGATTLGTGTLNGSGQATLSIVLPQGSHSVTAVYAGDATHQTSASSPVTQVVIYGTTTTLTSSVNPSTVGQSVTFTATVTGSSPTGTVTFMEDATVLTTSSVNGSGQATYSTFSLSAGTHNITAVYGGDATHQTSTSNTVSQVVYYPTTTTLNLTPNPSAVGQNIVFTATVTGDGDPPTGTVKFYDGATFLAERPVKPTGEAVLNRSTLSAGTHNITAVYGGDATHQTSASSPVSQVVANTTTTTLTSSVNPSGPGQSVTFTATVTGSGGTATGTVTFKDGGDTLGTGTLNGSGQTTFSTSSLSSGSHSITAVYGGDATHQTSASSPVSQAVLNATTTTLTSSVNPSTVGQNVTFTATITGSGGTATGTVTFKEGSTVLATSSVLPSGKATANISTLTAGTHSITAIYSGDASHATSTSNTVTQVVN